LIDNKKERIFGLDLIRAIAIILVVLSHLSMRFADFPNLIFPLPDGVDIFFVLSGFLIGKIIIETIETNQGFTSKSALNFLIRRWFRTLPNYFLFLAINLILIYYSLIPGFINKYLVTYFVFFQNFYKPYDFLYCESWSLSVEEWFYFLFPFLYIAFYKITKPFFSIKQNLLVVIIVFLSFSFIYRLVQVNPNLDWDLYFRKLVLTRLDTIAFGFLAAYIYKYHPISWDKYKNMSFVLGLLLIIIVQNINGLYFKQTFYFTLISIALALLFPKLNSFKHEKIRFKPIRFISKISFSMYLVHLPVLYILTGKFGEGINSNILILFFWVMTILISYIIYRLYEMPLMNFRDRIKL
tara:strand:+ start:64 stop:1122 length:1059 start_codon:yes stop_codon:yes gene_type:complete